MARMNAEQKKRIAKAFDSQRDKDKNRSKDGRVRVNRSGTNYLIPVSPSVVDPIVEKGLVNMRYVPEITDEGILFRPVGTGR